MSLDRRNLLLAGMGAAVTITAPRTILAQNDPGYRTPATTVAQTGALPDNEKRLDIVTLRDVEAEAQKGHGNLRLRLCNLQGHRRSRASIATMSLVQ
jgi:hypothetical protein